jgi:excinuclease UvrABC nuclease subunit
MSLINKLEVLLEEENFLPVSDKTWSSFSIIHRTPNDDNDKKKQYNFLKEKVGKKAGIYIYKKDDYILYIGKARELKVRLNSHYIESFSTVHGDTKDNRWHRFFSQHKGEMNILWKEVETEEERQIVELILTRILKPVFLEFK